MRICAPLHILASCHFTSETNSLIEHLGYVESLKEWRLDRIDADRVIANRISEVSTESLDERLSQQLTGM